MIGCGIKAENYEKAYSEIVAQLDDMKCGNITDAEIDNSKRMIISGIKQMWDNPSAMEAYNFRRVLAGVDELPEQTIEKVLAVTKSDIVAVANKIRISAIYFLEGKGDGEEVDYE
jgi:predicted Zn-dependent peptidase